MTLEEFLQHHEFARFIDNEGRVFWCPECGAIYTPEGWQTPNQSNSCGEEDS